MIADQRLISDKISEIFDEFQSALWTEKRVHPSEEVNRNIHENNFSESKVYRIINSYHIHCLLCHQHLYSRSVANDINSFFQKHINTEYHETCKVTTEWTGDQIEWEEKWYTGRCNVCNMSGLNAYVIDTDVSHFHMMEWHQCFWKNHCKDGNDKFLSTLKLLKQYCGLSVFYEKFLKSWEESTICLLCVVRIKCHRDRARSHLYSNLHYLNFLAFAWSNFGFSAKDLLNGFNLEMVTQWLLLNQYPMVTNRFRDVDEESKCREESDDDALLYGEWTETNFSFFPKDMENFKFRDVDYICDKVCLLCNVKASAKHCKSEKHLAAAKDAKVGSTSKHDLIYEEVRKKRLERRRLLMEKLQNLKNQYEDPKIRVDFLRELEMDLRIKEGPPHLEYLNKLLKDKLDLVEEESMRYGECEDFCEVCDEWIPIKQTNLHRMVDKHLWNIFKWHEIRMHFEDERFVEPFQRVKNEIVCLLCRDVFNEAFFFSHVKQENHGKKYQWYANFSFPVPIYCTLKVKSDYSCICMICNLWLTDKPSRVSLLKMLKKKLHWPCPKSLEDNIEVTRKEARNPLESEADVERDSKAVSKQEEKREESDEIEFTFDSERFQKSIKNIVLVFADRVVDEVTKRFQNVLNEAGEKYDSVVERASDAEVNKSENHVSVQNPSEEEVRAPVETKDSVPELHATEEGEASTETETKKSSEDETVGLKRGNEEEEEDNSGKKQKVLLIKGLPKQQILPEAVYLKFIMYGNIRQIYYEEDKVYVSFVRSDALKSVVEKPPAQMYGYPVTVETVLVNEFPMSALSYDVLHKKMREILKYPIKLKGLIGDLVQQSEVAHESYFELQREALVCKMIINCLCHYFPLVRCYPYGSRVSGLTLNSSDLDVFVDCGYSYDGVRSKIGSSEKKLVRRIGELLRSRQDVSKITVVDRARVPIVSFVHNPSSLHCDLSFKNGLSVHNTMLVRFMISLDNRVKPLILFLKYWASLNSIHGNPFFSSYAIAMMVIYFLQQLPQPMLPTIESLQKAYQGRRLTIGGWDCSFNSNPAMVLKSANTDSVPQLLEGFFLFYSNFNYEKYIISPLTGKPLPRDAWCGKMRLPMSYKRHIINLPLDQIDLDRIPLCVLDPFDLSHILTKGFHKCGLETFVQLCGDSYRFLSKGLRGYQGSPKKTVISSEKSTTSQADQSEPVLP